MSVRQKYAIRLHQKDYDLRHINELLGHETLSATKKLNDVYLIKLCPLAGMF